LKNAEASIIEKYSSEVKSMFDKLLEQEETPPGMEGDFADLGGDLGVPPETGLEEPGMEMGGPEEEELFEDDDELTLSATDGLDKSDVRLNEEDDEVPVTVNLDALREAIENLENQLDEEEELDLNEQDLAALFEEDAEELDEEIELADDLNEEEGDPLDAMADAIMEKLRVDTGADLSGWAGSRSEEKKYQMERGLAARKSTGVDEEIKAMKKAQEELVFENKSLKKKISQLASVLEQAKDNLQEVNVSNARLLYTNRVLRNTSLNERQKTKIVEAISKAGSVKEAKTIFESLQSTVASTPNRRPQSLSEAISRPSQLIRASRHQDQKPVDPFTDRWKKLAGI
jgi:DNA repair exonuclease SbcCD ATPase subunit